jgi:hypothetical protein
VRESGKLTETGIYVMAITAHVNRTVADTPWVGAAVCVGVLTIIMPRYNERARERVHE